MFANAGDIAKWRISILIASPCYKSLLMICSLNIDRKQLFSKRCVVNEYTRGSAAGFTSASKASAHVVWERIPANFKYLCALITHI